MSDKIESERCRHIQDRMDMRSTLEITGDYFSQEDVWDDTRQCWKMYWTQDFSCRVCKRTLRLMRRAS